MMSTNGKVTHAPRITEMKVGVKPSSNVIAWLALLALGAYICMMHAVVIPNVRQEQQDAIVERVKEHELLTKRLDIQEAVLDVILRNQLKGSK